MAVPQTLPHKHIPRGDVPMSRTDKNKQEVPNIVKTYRIGGSTIHIADNYVAKTPEEVEKVLDRLHAVGWRIVEDLAEKGKLV